MYDTNIDWIGEWQAIAKYFEGYMTVQESATHCIYSASTESNLLLAFHVAVSFLESDGLFFFFMVQKRHVSYH